MRNNPKRNEQKLLRVLNAWETLAAGKSFGGLTLEQFRESIAPVQAARAQVDDLQAQLIQAIKTRDAADEAALAKTQFVVRSVAGDPTAGPDSALYKAMGYTLQSERKSGLTRKAGPAPPAVPRT